MHAEESVLAFLVITLWHLYNVHAAPGRFPVQWTFWNGKINRDHQIEEHFLEYERQVKEGIAECEEEKLLSKLSGAGEHQPTQVKKSSLEAVISSPRENFFEWIKILGDVDYVRNSNFLICRMEKGDHPCGTFGEACIAVEHNIPIYVIQTMARTEYSGSFVQFVFTSGGGFFNSQTELMEYIDKKYKLKIRKGINNE